MTARIAVSAGGRKEEEMKKCHRCGTAWRSFRAQPGSRDVCEGCGAYLHSCSNCRHFDRLITCSCKLPHTSFIGARDSLNYCEDFRMLDSFVRAEEERVERAKCAWEQLFRR